MTPLAEIDKSDERQYCASLNSQILSALVPVVKDLISSQSSGKQVLIDVPSRATIDEAKGWELDWDDYYNEEWRMEALRFGAALRWDGMLCGLLLGRFDRSVSALRIFMIESNQHVDHAFQGYVLIVADLLLQTAAVQAGVDQIRFEHPAKKAIRLFGDRNYLCVNGNPSYCVKVIKR